MIELLESAGFVNKGGKGSHRNFVHPNVAKPITIPGKAGLDAKHYLIKSIELAVEDSKNESK